MGLTKEPERGMSIGPFDYVCAALVPLATAGMASPVAWTSTSASATTVVRAGCAVAAQAALKYVHLIHTPCKRVGGCDPLVTCNNVPGGRLCGSCPSGFRGNGASGCLLLSEATVQFDGWCETHWPGYTNGIAHTTDTLSQRLSPILYSQTFTSQTWASPLSVRRAARAQPTAAIATGGSAGRKPSAPTVSCVVIQPAQVRRYEYIMRFSELLLSSSFLFLLLSRGCTS